MTDLCPDCGRPKPECERCVGGSEARHDAWRELQCARVTIARLRRELAEALAIEELERAVVSHAVALVQLYHDEGNRAVESDELLAAVEVLNLARAATGEPKEE